MFLIPVKPSLSHNRLQPRVSNVSSLVATPSWTDTWVSSACPKMQLAEVELSGHSQDSGSYSWAPSHFSIQQQDSFQNSSIFWAAVYPSVSTCQCCSHFCLPMVAQNFLFRLFFSVTFSSGVCGLDRCAYFVTLKGNSII